MDRLLKIGLGWLACLGLCTGCTDGTTETPSVGADRSDQAAAAQTAVVDAAQAELDPGGVQSLAPGCRVDGDALVAGLKRRDFESVTATLQPLQAQVRAGACSDRWLARALGAFGNSDPALLPLLDAWVAGEPRSAFARTARGMHHVSRAANERGIAVARRTPRSQLAAMELALASASEDLRAALRHDPELTPAHAGLIDIARMSAGPLQERPILDRGLGVAPHSFAIREALLIRLQPRWGGSLEAIDWLLSDTRQHEGRDPELRRLRGFRTATEAHTLCLAKRRDEAIRRFDEALAEGDHAWARSRRMDCLYHAGRFDEAEQDARLLLAAQSYPGSVWHRLARIEERRGNREAALAAYERSLLHNGGNPDTLLAHARFARRIGRLDLAQSSIAVALEAAPSRSEVHAFHAELLMHEKRKDDALRAAERAVALDPAVARNWAVQARAQLRSRQNEAARASLDRAIELAPASAQLRYERGWTLARRFGDRHAALADLREATRLQPRSSLYWYELATAAWHARDCDVVTASRRFVALCDAGRCGKPNPASLDWARRRASDPAFAAMCPKEFAAADARVY
jgi:tetratricopeptide (TPR) repeat protein